MIGHDRDGHAGAGQPGKIPFWKGDGVGRPVGWAVSRFTREIAEEASKGGGRPEAATPGCASSTP
jgi:ATP-dependent Lhr-like helicase